MSDLVSLPLRDFTAALASDSPAPGGGSASAATGAAGAGLLRMVVALTLGKEKYRAAWDALEPVAPRLDESRARLLELVDEDTRAFDAIVAARRLPKGTDDEKAARAKAIEEATVLATATPLQTAFFCHQALAHALTVLEHGNPNAASDAWVGGLLLAAALEGALANVRINLGGIGDAELNRGFVEDAEDLERRSHAALDALRTVAKGKGL